MEIDLIFKIAAVGIIVSILNQVLSRTGRDEQATMTTLAGLVVVLMIVARKNQMQEIVSGVKSIDKKAFISVSSAMSVYGEGFEDVKDGLKKIKKDK